MKDVIALSRVQGDHIDVVQGKPADIYLSRLYVVYGKAVVVHRRVAGTEAAYRYGLEPADTPEVLHGNAGKVFNHVGQLQRIEVPNRFSQ
ncbi:hypothetical protein SDC9_171071 [bioreactor metagenome]|uniref:Uncharacterized protein n=1 Tax=bioreactor metagenome TaxID=1076179 RepID=A0A645G9V5_9ZZZZ